MSLGPDFNAYGLVAGNQPGGNEWLDQILQTIALNNPNYASLKGRLLSAPANLLGSSNFPAAPGIGAAQQTGGTGQVLTANPTTQTTSSASPVTATPAQTTATASAPVATSAPAGAPASSTPASSGAAPAAAATPSTPSATPPPAAVASAPALNPQTVNQVWQTMQQYGGGFGGGDAGSGFFMPYSSVMGVSGGGQGGGATGLGGGGNVEIGGTGGEGGIGSGGGGGFQV